MLIIVAISNVNQMDTYYLQMIYVIVLFQSERNLIFLDEILKRRFYNCFLTYFKVQKIKPCYLTLKEQKILDNQLLYF